MFLRTSAVAGVSAPRSSSLLRWFLVASLAALFAALAPGAHSPQPARAIATYTVNDAGNDSDFSPGDGVCDTTFFNLFGICTLRAAIEEANAGVGGDTIDIQVGSIFVPNALPDVVVPVTINSLTCGTPPCMEIQGGVSPYSALVLRGGSSTVRGLAIGGFDGAGIEMHDNGGNTIAGNHIGTDLSGTVAIGNGTGIWDVSPGNNTIGGTTGADRNVISGNVGNGVYIGPGVAGDLIQGNYIGTDKTALSDLGNGFNGVDINADSNVVGGATIAGRNVISGNDNNGVAIDGSSNTVRGNLIGTIPANSDIGNLGHGIQITGGSGNQIIGSNVYQIISGNDGDGINLTGATTTGTVVHTNFIGTGTNGLFALGNSGNGVHILNGANGNTVGSFGNVISANAQNGVLIEGALTNNNVVASNKVGADFNGTGDLGNALSGVSVSGTGANTIGAGNTISGNTQHGVFISGATGVEVRGNNIGTNSAGNGDLGNTLTGVTISGANGNTIGSAASPNIISGNDTNGVAISGNTNTVRNNIIGLNTAQTAALGNTQNGILISSGTGNVIGGTGTYQAISGNGGDGVQLTGAATANNSVGASLIGLNGAGIAAIGNAGHGVHILGGAHDNYVGASVSAISGNAGHGVLIEGAATINNTVNNSRIGTNLIGAASVGNGGSGVYVSGTGANRIGGDTPVFWTVISGNQANGVAVVNSTGVSLWGNYIGTDISGAADLGNAQAGVLVMSSVNTQIGGAVPGKRSVIAGNDVYGVYLLGPLTTTTTIQGNYIGLDAAGTAALPNGTAGILMFNGAINNTVGGTLADQRNVIAGHSYAGIWITGGATSNTVRGNYIGTNVAGTAALGNGVGVFLENTATGNTVGGTAAGAGNLISGNGNYGIFLASNGNTVQGNRIGTDAAGTAPLGNSLGIMAVAANNVIGGIAAGAANTIAYNGYDGIQINGAGATGNTIRANSIHHHDLFGGLGIRNYAGGNTELPPPAYTSIVVGSVSGTACANCTVDVFSDAGDEGATYHGSTVANGAGVWTYSGSVTGPNVSTTATDAAGNTSQFNTLPYDTDGDTVVDGYPTPVDNCPAVANVGQEWSDRNFIDQTPPSTQDDRTWPNSDPSGDACDTDDDNDGISDANEATGAACSGTITNPIIRDTDGDRVLDGAECTLGFDPTTTASKPTIAQCAAHLGVASTADTDADKVRDYVEFCNYNTDPNDTDTDNDQDGLPPGLAKDGCEAASLNGDRLITAADQLLIAVEMIREPSPALRLASMDINKDSVVTAADQLILATFISPAGQCP